MAYLADIDPYYIKAITAMHSKDHLLGGKPMLQGMLEEAIKSKTGLEKNFTSLLQSIYKPASSGGGSDEGKLQVDESKTTSSSDNELELDLLKEDLMCIVCHGMDVTSRNRLLECTDCHNLYHQECHQPVVSQQEAETSWMCNNCKELKKKKTPPVQTHSSSSTKSDRHKHSSYKSSKDKSSKESKDSKEKSSSKSKSSRHSTTGNSNIISADKRIQNMKKKAAAELHKKKKLPH